MFGRNTALGIDIGDDAIRIVALRATGADYAIVQAAYLPLAAENAEGEVTAQLTEFVREARVHGRRVACGLRASDCAVKTATLPPATPAELAQVIRFEAETQFPLPLPDMVWGYTLTPQPSGRSHAVIAGARKVAAEERLTQLRAAGLTPAVLLPAPLAATGAVAHPEGLHLFVLAGTRWSDLCLYDGDRLLGCRSVLAGAPDGEDWASRIQREARSWLVGETRPRQVVLAGLVSKEAGEILAEATDLPVTHADPGAGVPGADIFTEKLAESTAAYATAIGLAKAALQGKAPLNLLPETVTQANASRRRLNWALAALVLIAALLLPVALEGQQRLTASRLALQAATNRAQKARRDLPPAPGAGVMAAQQVVDSLAEPGSRPLDLLRELSAQLPASVSLTDFIYDRGKAVLTLKGHADSSADEADALKTLSALPGVKRAMLDATTAGRDGKGFDFQITCLLAASTDPTVMGKANRAGEAHR